MPEEKKRVEHIIQEVVECSEALAAFHRRIEAVAHGRDAGDGTEPVRSLFMEEKSNATRFKNKSRMLLFSVAYFADPGAHPRDRLSARGT